MAVQGELDILTVPELRSVLRSCTTKSDHSDIIIDLAALEFIDVQGLSVLLESRRRLDAYRRKLSIAAPPACARRLLALTGLAEQFSVAPAPCPASN
ncbi:MAG: STAS domain-containing protein [Actinomycetota bacterium]|nr:STAS domain-containing protein [Actinomycetota bacterium]